MEFCKKGNLNTAVLSLEGVGGLEKKGVRERSLCVWEDAAKEGLFVG